LIRARFEPFHPADWARAVASSIASIQWRVSLSWSFRLSLETLSFWSARVHQT